MQHASSVLLHVVFSQALHTLNQREGEERMNAFTYALKNPKN